MSKRLQVILDDEEWKEIREVTQNQRLSVSEWVRRTLRQARRRLPEGERGRKLDALRAATRHSFPTGDVDRILGEIEFGYLGMRPEVDEDTGARRSAG
jgi:hypothetical protein